MKVSLERPCRFLTQLDNLLPIKSRISDYADEQLLYKSEQYVYLFSNKNKKGNKRR